MTDPAQNKKLGRFITFEGGDGVGKSTQIARLAARLKSAGFSVTTSREPGGTVGAEAVRHVILNAATAEPFGPEMEAMLFAAARSDHVSQLIRPAVERGEIVLVDRFIDSTRVYQGASNAMDQRFLTSLERVAIGGMKPDVTILLDLDPVEALARADARRANDADADRFEKEDAGAHKKRRDAFLKLASDEPDRICVVDASGTSDDVATRVWAVVRKAPAMQMVFASLGAPVQKM